MLAEVGELLEVVECEHGPALCALYREEAARGRGRALERDEPLDRRNQACRGKGKGMRGVRALGTFVRERREKRVTYPISPRACAHLR